MLFWPSFCRGTCEWEDTTNDGARLYSLDPPTHPLSSAVAIKGTHCVSVGEAHCWRANLHCILIISLYAADCQCGGAQLDRVTFNLCNELTCTTGPPCAHQCTTTTIVTAQHRPLSFLKLSLGESSKLNLHQRRSASAQRTGQRVFSFLFTYSHNQSSWCVCASVCGLHFISRYLTIRTWFRF